MNTTEEKIVKATQDYFRTLHSRGDEILSGLLQKGASDSPDVLVTEQIIQDYLAAVFQPFTGSWKLPEYIQDDAPVTFQKLKHFSDSILGGRVRFGLIGAHYRSSLSARGRRSAFSINRRSLSRSLKDLLGPHPLLRLWETGEKGILGTLWEVVYLEQYFSLFDRKLTLGEWAFEQDKKVPIVILSEQSASSRQLEEFYSGPLLAQVIVLPERLTEALLSQDLLTAFAKGVADGIVEAVDREPGILRLLMRHSDKYPGKTRLGTWSRLVRSANALARDSILRRQIDKELTLRHSYATGLVLYHSSGKDLRDRLLRLFPGNASVAEDGQPTIEWGQLSKLLRVFQSLQFYTRRYGENCVTFPYRSSTASTRGDSRRRPIRQGELMDNKYYGEGFQSSVTLFWNGGRNLGLINEIVEGARGIFGQLTNLVDRHLRTRRASVPEPEQGNKEVVRVIRRDSGGLLAGDELDAVLSAARDLSRALYEGKPRAFSFVLGSPEWLISDLSVVHDLMGSNLRYQVTRSSSLPFSYERTLALLRGNSAFFQDDALALFLPYPGLPLEITHVVRIPNENGTGRRQLLSSFSRDKKAAVAVATYGSGTGEVIHDGEVKAVLSVEGKWVPASGYLKLIKKLREQISDLSDEETAQKVVERLEPCLRRISEEPGIGGLFVIARERAADRLKGQSISLTEVLETIDGRSLPELDPRAIYDLARDDGATIVAIPSMRVWGRRLLSASSASGLRGGATANGHASLADQIQVLEWGTRRRTAQRVSQNLKKEGFAIVISADGPINILQNGEVLEQFGERYYVQRDNDEVEDRSGL